MKISKTCVFIFLISLFSNFLSSQEDPTSLWIFRMEQNASEDALFEKLQGNRTNAPTSVGLFSKNDTLKYASGTIFRTCEVANSMLNGSYKIYYPSGKLYSQSIYKNNTLADSSMIYTASGVLESVIYYPDLQTQKQIYFDNNRKIKKIDSINVIPAGSTTFQSGYVHTNTMKQIKTDYFKSDGTSITKKEYYKLHPEEKNK